jgi:ribonuclease BN (tRNA processing enzyme)
MDDVEVRDWNLLFDLGNGALGPLLRHVDVADVDTVCLTHLHPDHCADLAGLYVHLKYHPVNGSAVTGRLRELPVYGPSNLPDRIEEMCGISDGVPMVGPFSFHPRDHGDRFTIGPMRVAAFPVRHPVEAYDLTGL